MIQDRSRKVQNVLDLVEQFAQLLLPRGLAPFVHFDSCGYVELPPRRPSSGDTLETALNPNTTPGAGCSGDFDVQIAAKR
jgi:hypothetical protein